MPERYFRRPDDPMYVPDRGPEAVAPPPQIYEKMGPAKVRAMLVDFYEELGRSSIAGMFPGDKLAAAERSALFFIGLLGGPPVYAQAFGSPRMRARHLPFRITPEFQEIWLECFDRVLLRHEEYSMTATETEEFRRFLRGFSAWMVNTQSSVENRGDTER